MSNSARRNTKGWRRAVSAWLLAVAGGGADAVVLLGFHVLTAAQTGNTVLLAVALARGDAVGGTSAALSVSSFVLGVALGAVLLGRAVANRGTLLPTLLTEASLLLGLLGFWISVQPLNRHQELGVIGLAALAMGLQSAIVLHLRGPGTTYMTGTLTTFSSGLVEWVRTRVRRSDPASVGQPSVRPSVEPPWPSGVSWLLYLFGAIGCGLLFLHVGPLAFSVPAGAVCLVVLLQLGVRTRESEQDRSSM
ncbi:MAG: YoaK family protein [Thiohalocapsa sp.]